MIGKKVENPRKSGSKAARIGRLVDYIRSPEDESGQEKCLYAGARGFVSNLPEVQRAEMVALAQDAVRTKDPVSHFVFSWQEGEHPTPEQVEEAVTLILGEMGVSEHQAIYGLHADTDNDHLHVVVNRVDPVTGKVVKINKGFDKEAAHMAAARVEHAQGWQREPHGRYVVTPSGELVRSDDQRQREPGPSQKMRDMEWRTGEKSAERIAVEQGAAVIREARTWEELHERLAERGMRFQKKGSGALVFVRTADGEVPVKASAAGRDCSLAAVQKRLGVYQAAAEQVQVEQRAPEPVRQDVPGWTDYNAQRRAHYADKSVATVDLQKRHDEERKALAVAQKARRAQVLGGRWKGRGDELNVMRSVLAAEQASAKAELRERHQEERAELRKRFRPFPDLEVWLTHQRSPEIADRWRYGNGAPPPRLVGDRYEKPVPRDIRDFEATVRGSSVFYAPRAGSVAFVDRGRRLDVHDTETAAVLAALQLSAQKWGEVTIAGTDDFKAKCAGLAAERGIRIANPELRPILERARAERGRGPTRDLDRGSERAPRGPDMDI